MRQTPEEAWLDTNVVLRLLLNDANDAHNAAATRLFESAASGQRILHLPTLVIGECVYVLSGRKRVPRADAADAMLGLLHRSGVRCQDREAIIRALGLWRKRPGLHFVDCYLIASAEASGRAVASFDGGIARTKLVPVLDASSA